MNFGTVRQEAFGWWGINTGRVFHTHPSGIEYDSYTHSFECDWQIMARDMMGDPEYHVSHFCSLADSASSITDMLVNPYLDKLDFSQDVDQEILFRWYTRFLFTASEVIDDLRQIARDAGYVSGRRVNHHFDPNLDKLMGFINTVCKHRAGREDEALHKHNHHLPKLFEDSGDNVTESYDAPLCMGAIFTGSQKADCVVMPSLQAVIDIVTNCYRQVYTWFEGDESKFQSFCESNGCVLPSEPELVSGA